MLNKKKLEFNKAFATRLMVVYYKVVAIAFSTFIFTVLGIFTIGIVFHEIGYTLVGPGEALSAFIAFLIARKISQYVTKKNITDHAQQISVEKSWISFRVLGLPNIILGSEIAFLALVFHGIIGAVWEGFFNSNYIVLSGSFRIEVIGLVVCFMLALDILYPSIKKIFSPVTSIEQEENLRRLSHG